MSVITRGIAPELLEPMVDKIFFQEYMEQPQRYKAVYKNVPMDKAFWDDITVAGVGRFQLLPEGMPIAFTNIVQGARRRETTFNFALGLRISHNMRRDEQHGMIQKFVKDLARSASDSQDRFAHGPINDGHSGSIYLGRFEGDGQRRALWSTGHVPLRNTATTHSNKLNPGVAFNADGIKSALNIFATMQSEEERYISMQPDIVFAHPFLRWDIETLLESTNEPTSADNAINVVKGNRIGVTPEYSEKISDTDSWSLWKRGGEALMYLDREKLRTQQTMDDLTMDAIELAYYSCNVAIGDWHSTVGSAPP
jgi:hypothetical protein